MPSVMKACFDFSDGDMNKVKDFYELIEAIQVTHEELKSDSKLLEKFARERYLMKKDNEDIFLLVEDSLEKK